MSAYDFVGRATFAQMAAGVRDGGPIAAIGAVSGQADVSPDLARRGVEVVSGGTPQYVTTGTAVAVSDVLASLAPAFATLVAARLLLGAAIGAFWATGVEVGPRLVPADRATEATSIITAGISAGTVVSLPLGDVLSAQWGWRAALATSGSWLHVGRNAFPVGNELAT